MTREFSHEYGYRHYAETAQDERAAALTRAGFLVIAGADRALRQSAEILSSSVSSLVRGWQEYRERRATYRALTKLDDRLLRDIGLTRADIEGSTGSLQDLEAVIEAAAPLPASRSVPAFHDLKRAA